MVRLLAISRWIDAASSRIGRSLSWLILAAVVIAAANAVIRKTFNYSSNAFLEVQWYLFSATFLLGAGYVLQKQEHVRIDVISGRFPRRVQIWIDVIGICAFLLPFAAVVVWLSTPLAIKAFIAGETSSNASGLLRWPVYALLPLGFTWLAVQGCSELIKRVAFLRGLGPDPTGTRAEKTAEEELAEFLKAQEAEAQGTKRD